MLSINTLPGFTAPALDKAAQSSRLAVERISSLKRLNSAKDDAAGIAIAARLAAQILGDQTAQRGVDDGQSLADTAEAGVAQVQDRMQRMRELALQAGNGSLNDSDRRSLDREYQQLGQEVNRELGSTRFNGKAVLGDDAGSFRQSAGADPGQMVSVDTADLRQSANLQAVTGGNIQSASSATQQLRALDLAQDDAGDLRATLGAAGSRMAAVSDSLAQQSVAASASYGRLTDADLAAETARLQSAQAAHYAAMQQLLQMGQTRRGALLALLA